MGVTFKWPLIATALLAMTVAASGCSEREAAAGEIQRLKNEIQSIKGMLDAVGKDHEALASRVDVIEFMREMEGDKSATFDIASKGYGRVNHNTGFFLISLADAKPKGDGYELTFKFGNPLEVTYTGAKFRVRWGPRLPTELKGMELSRAMEERSKKMRQKDISLVNTFHPGSWNAVSFVVAPAPADTLGFIEISQVATDQLALRGK